MGVVGRFSVYLVNLDPTVRPCVVISPDELNRHVRTVIVAPLTSADRPYPSRIACTFQGRAGHVVLDQLRTVDKQRLGQQLGVLSTEVAQEVLAGLARLFAP